MQIAQKGPKELNEYGYSIINSNLKIEYNSFERLLVQRFNTILRSENDDSFEFLDSMSNYHKIIEKSNISHHDLIKKISRTFL